MKKFSLFFLSFLFIISTSGFGQVIYTVVGNGKVGDSGEGGPAIDAEIGGPWAVTLDKAGNLYLCDGNKVKKISPAYNGIITTIAGSGYYGYTGDSCLATNAGMAGPFDLTFDSKGNMYIADAINNRIRKVNIHDSITTIAGTGIGGYNGDSILAINATLNYPMGVAVDSIGNVYVADRDNHRIRKIDTAGIITTIAGTGVKRYSPDSVKADTAALEGPIRIRVNEKGEIFFTDSIERVRKIVKGIITTIAGNGIEGYSGDGGPATMAELSAAAIDLDTLGNLFIADDLAGLIRKVNSAGIISTVAGGGSTMGDGGDPLKALLAVPQGVTVNNLGDIYICDNGHERVRLVTSHLPVSDVSNKDGSVSIYPNPCRGQFNIRLHTALKQNAELNIRTAEGKVVYHTQLQTGKAVPIITGLPSGFYIVNTTMAQQHFVNKLIIQ